MKPREIPNFLVGLALIDEGPTTRDRRTALRARIASRVGVTPVGLGPVAGDRTLTDLSDDSACKADTARSRGVVEQRLAQWCLTQLGLHLPPGPTCEYVELWNGWVGCEEEIYRACAGFVSTLSLTDVETICGSETRSAAQAVLRQFA